MGMTIDKTIEFFNGLECYTPQAKDARDVAIDTMHKYQKIEQIVNAEFEEYHPLDRNIYRLALIRKVIEDGSTN